LISIPVLGALVAVARLFVAVFRIIDAGCRMIADIGTPGEARHR